MGPFRVGVIDQHEIFRRGVVVCLREEPDLLVAVDVACGPVGVELCLAVVSSPVAQRESFTCPVLVCTSEPWSRADWSGNKVMGVLPRETLTPQQLVSAVHAAAAGLEVSFGISPEGGRLDERSLDVLRLLAQGADTSEISSGLRCSERTIKAVIQQVKREFGARSRAQAVAEGIRHGVI